MPRCPLTARQQADVGAARDELLDQLQVRRVVLDVEQGARLAPPRGTIGSARAAASPPFRASRGSATESSSNQNTLPAPTVLSTPIAPPISSTSRLVTTRPMPVPSSPPASCPRRLKGWKSCASFSGGSPAPVSVMLTRMRPGARLGAAHHRPCPARRLYLIALESRLIRTCFTRVRSASTKQGIVEAGERSCGCRAAAPAARSCPGTRAAPRPATPAPATAAPAATRSWRDRGSR